MTDASSTDSSPPTHAPASRIGSDRKLSVKPRRTPKHFASAQSFTRYIYVVAIRDLTALVDAHTPKLGAEPDESTKKLIEETRLEIAAIRARLKHLRRVRPTSG